MKTLPCFSRKYLWVFGLALALHTGASAQTSPYVGQQTRPIKALSESDVRALLEGQGAGYAKTAELNGYPGPLHVLELAEPLKLTAVQREHTERLLLAHKGEARRLGAEMVEAERLLDQAFADKRIDSNTLRQHLERIAALQAALRGAHLRTHLEQTALLSPIQIERYASLRGYRETHSQKLHHSTH